MLLVDMMEVEVVVLRFWLVVVLVLLESPGGTRLDWLLI